VILWILYPLIGLLAGVAFMPLRNRCGFQGRHEWEYWFVFVGFWMLVLAWAASRAYSAYKRAWREYLREDAEE